MVRMIWHISYFRSLYFILCMYFGECPEHERPYWYPICIRKLVFDATKWAFYPKSIIVSDVSLKIGNIWPKYWWISFGWEGLVMPLLLVIDTCGRFGHTRNKLRWGKERKTMKKGWKRQKGGIREKPRRIYFQYWEKIELYYPNYLDCTLIWIKFFLLFLVIYFIGRNM